MANFPTTYHTYGAVLIITDDENVSNASGIKTFLTDVEKKERSERRHQQDMDFDAFRA